MIFNFNGVQPDNCNYISSDPWVRVRTYDNYSAHIVEHGWPGA